MINVLLIDGHDRRTLAAVRNLGRRTGEFNAIVGSSRRINSSRFSRYCDEFIRYPNPDADENEFIDFLVPYIKNNKIHVLLPMGDDLTELVVKNLDKFKQVTEILVPELEVFNIARNKELTLKFAERCGVPCPKRCTLEDVKKGENINYPIVIKPRISTGSIGMMIANDREQALEYYDKINNRFENPIIQEMIPDVGEHYQANLLFDKNGKLKASCIKKKIRQFPVYGGPSTFFKTVKHKEIEKLSVRLLKNINWIGPAEVEYMVDPRDGVPKLMEINPRLSATIRLSCYVGVDFPYLIVKNALGGKTEAIKNTKFDYYCQWFVPGDFMNFLFNKDRFKQKYGYIFNKPRDLCHMTYESGDLMPYLANLVAYGISFFNPGKLKRFINR